MKLTYLISLFFISILLANCSSQNTTNTNEENLPVDTVEVTRKKEDTKTPEIERVAKELLKNVKGCYTPTLVPVKFCLNANGKFTVATAQKLVFLLGSIDFSSSATFNVPENKLVVQINTPTKSYFYEIKKDDQLKLKINGKAYLAIENHRIVIDVDKAQYIAIVFENTEKPSTEANDQFLSQFLGISKGMGIGQVVKKFTEGYEVKRTEIGEKYAAYEFRVPTSQKTVAAKDTNTVVKQSLLMSIVYRRKSGEIMTILANRQQVGVKNGDIFRLAKSRNIVDYKVNLFRSVRGDIKTFLSNYEAINETNQSITFIEPCNFNCYPKLTFITKEEDLYKCTRILLFFESVNSDIEAYLDGYSK